MKPVSSTKQQDNDDQMASDTGGCAEQDHRIRVAREKRERMRERLLQSVMSVCSSKLARGPAVIDDVIRHANVSRGTFYKYFDSLDQAIALLGTQLADQMTADISTVYDVLDDPVLRVATGFQLFLLRSISEPEWGSFIAHIDLLGDENLIMRAIRSDLGAGADTGDFYVESLQVASDLIVGAMVEATRRIVSNGANLEYVKAMTRMMLRSLSVSPVKAEKSVAKAFERLAVEAPALLPWWRPFVTA